MLQHGREIAPSVSWEILVHVKRTGGISVNELAALLKMSYMGVKQHCDALKRRGYLDTWRRPKATGRPEKIFRPTVKLDLVLPNWGNELCFNILAYSAQLQGETAPERLLHSFLQQKAEFWAAKLKGKTQLERARQFVKVRNAEGWMCDIVEDETGLRIVEHHSPLSEIARIYPAIWAIECRALERCFEGEITRVNADGQTYLQLPPSADYVPPIRSADAIKPAPPPSSAQIKAKKKEAEAKQLKQPPAPKAEAAPEVTKPQAKEGFARDHEPFSFLHPEPEPAPTLVPEAQLAPKPEPKPEPPDAVVAASASVTIFEEPASAPVLSADPPPEPEPPAPTPSAVPPPSPPSPPAAPSKPSSKKRNEPQGFLFDFD